MRAKNNKLEEYQKMLKRKYSYEYLTSLPDMKLTPIDVSKITPDTKIADIIEIAKQNVLDEGGSKEGGSISINTLTGYRLIVGKNGLMHGTHLYSTNANYKQIKDKNKINLEILPTIGKILKEAIPINELNTDGSDSKQSDLGLVVFVSGAIKNNQYIPILIIARHTINTYNNIIEEIYPLKSINAKNAQSEHGKVVSYASSPHERINTINIRNVLEQVKNVFPEYFSENVREELGLSFDLYKNPNKRYEHSIACHAKAHIMRAKNNNELFMVFHRFNRCSRR